MCWFRSLIRPCVETSWRSNYRKYCRIKVYSIKWEEVINNHKFILNKHSYKNNSYSPSPFPSPESSYIYDYFVVLTLGYSILTFGFYCLLMSNSVIPTEQRCSLMHISTWKILRWEKILLLKWELQYQEQQHHHHRNNSNRVIVIISNSRHEREEQQLV